MHFKASSLHSH